jgi:aspartate 1-decarboxylase
MAATRRLFKSKLHRIRVTQADLDYEGSVTLDAELMSAADIVPYEEVHIWNVTRGTRLTTYALEGERGSRVCCINGAAAHLVSPGDIVIIATFTDVPEADCATWQPTVVLLDAENRIKGQGPEIPGPERRVPT